MWCNDRSVTSTTYNVENYVTNKVFDYSANTRIYENSDVDYGVVPELICNRNVDKFTVEKENGNGDLTYSIGLLTADELALAGLGYLSNRTTYLSLTSTNANQWLLSPNAFNNTCWVSVGVVKKDSLSSIILVKKVALVLQYH